MHLDHFFENIQKIQPLTPEAKKALADLLEIIELKKSDFLFREGDRVHHAGFLIKGVIRVYYNKDGNEYNKTFFIPGTFPTPLTALLTSGVSQLDFQALTDCVIVRFPYRKFKELFDRHRSLERLMLRILEQIWIKKERHDIHMVTNDATTNYFIFRKEFPGLEQQIPQYHIASYLGITPIQLSRIRAKLSSKG
ncbi:MAG: Crp/Fnr family transcriptional regulator [Bacteroidetes bacterium]|nr:MAG: Crp/Fnr family transcriptional regulator [Bacteroidota bacterium]